jgi:hypothetical protein
LALGLAACHSPAPQAACEAQREAYDRAFKLAVEYGARRDFDRQNLAITEAQNLVITMQNQGCCKQIPNVCPALNVH